MSDSRAPDAFDIDTAAEDFAGPGRVVQINPRPRGSLPQRHMYVKANGWTISVTWSWGTYCTGARSAWGLDDEVPTVSPDAEVAAWKGDGGMIDLHGDAVEGWVSPASVVKAIEAAERDDENGIREALVRDEG